MKTKQVLFSLVTLAATLSAWAANSSDDVELHSAHFNEQTYLMDVTSAKGKSGSKLTLIPGVIRYGRWVYATEDGTCEQLEVKLNGFVQIPMNGGFVQQPDTSFTKTPVACPRQGSKG